MRSNSKEKREAPPGAAVTDTSDQNLPDFWRSLASYKKLQPDEEENEYAQ